MPNESSGAGPVVQAGAVTPNSAGPPAPPPAAATPRSDPAGNDRPVLSVLRGEPTEAELAAVIAVLAVASRAAAARASPPTPAGASRSAWSAPSRRLRESLSPGPGAWRRSAFPR